MQCSQKTSVGGRDSFALMSGCDKVGKEADVSEHSDAKLHSKTELILSRKSIKPLANTKTVAWYFSDQGSRRRHGRISVPPQLSRLLIHHFDFFSNHERIPRRTLRRQ